MFFDETQNLEKNCIKTDFILADRGEVFVSLQQIQINYVRRSIKTIIHKVIHNFIRTGTACAAGEFPENAP